MPVAKTWSDLDINFTAHPKTGSLIMKKDAEAIVRSVQHLLLTNHYERPFNPELGSHLSARLFEPMSHSVTLQIKDDIVETINNFEPRVRISELNVRAQEEHNGYEIYLRFFILNEEVERQVTFFLERLR